MMRVISTRGCEILSSRILVIIVLPDVNGYYESDDALWCGFQLGVTRDSCSHPNYGTGLLSNVDLLEGVKVM